MTATIIHCPNLRCRKRLKVDNSTVGKSARCHRCETKFRLSLSKSADGSQVILPIDPELPSESEPVLRLPGMSGVTKTIPIPDRIGRFRVLSVLGGGAFGVVYLANDPELERDVAVKLPKPGTLTTPTRIKRFLGDAKAAARLRHPHIVPVFDVGEHEGGWFIASAYVEGRTLSEASETKSLDLRSKVQIIRRMAEALEYAHGQGVVHRDVKPDNVMLDAADQPHLIDFGLAKLGDDREGGGRAVMGTPAYMSPEQAAGRSHDADAKSDQYSLGVTFYELLGGQAPFSGPPSIVLYHMVKSDPPPLASLDSSLPIDLILICNKAMAKEPTNRYDSCGEFADDLRRWLDGETPRVRTLTRKERVQRWVKKEPRLARAIGVAAAAILMAAVLGVTFGVLSTQQAGRLAVAQKQAEENAIKEALARKQADANAIKEADARTRADASALQTRRTLASTHFDRAVGLCEHGEIAQGMNWFVEALREAESAGDPALAAAARINLNAWRHQLHVVERAVPLLFHPLATAVSPSGDAVVTAGELNEKGYLHWMSFSEGSVGQRTVNIDHPVRAIAFDPVGQVLVVGNSEGQLLVYSRNGGQIGSPLALPSKILSVAVHPEGKKILAGCADGFARLISLKETLDVGLSPEGEAKRFEHSQGFEVNAVAFHPEPGTPLILTGAGASVDRPTARTKGGNLGEARLIHASTGELLASLDHRGAVRSLAFHPVGHQFIVGSGSLWMGEGRVWSTATRLPIQGGVFPHIAEVNAVAYSPDGRYLFTAGQDRSIRVWDAVTFKSIGQPLWHGKDVRALATTNGRVIAVGDENAVRVWGLAPGPFRKSGAKVPDSPILYAAQLPGDRGHWVSKLAALGPVVERRGAADGRSLGVLPPLPGPVRVIEPAKDGVALGGGFPDPVPEGFPPGFATLCDFNGQPGEIRKTNSAVWAVGRSPDGKILAAGCDNGEMRAWTTNGTQLWYCDPKTNPDAHIGRVYATVFHPSGRWLLTCARDKTATIRDAETGRVVYRIELPDIGMSATFAPDGNSFLVGYAGGGRLFRWREGHEPERLGADLQHQAGIIFVAFDDNGNTVLTGGSDRRVRWWDVKTGKPLGPGWPTEGLVRAAGFTDSRRVFVAQTDHQRGEYESFELPFAPLGSAGDLGDWVKRSSGIKLEKGVTEVLNVADLTARPGSPLLIEESIASWRKSNPPGSRPVPVRLALGPTPMPPHQVVKNEPNTSPMREEPKPMPPVEPVVKPKPNKPDEKGGLDITLIPALLFQLIGGK